MRSVTSAARDVASLSPSNDGAVIRTPDHRLRVFISSTLKELADERETVRESVAKLHLVPVMFETGARPYPARELYQAYLSQSHIFIGIYWQSYGWIGPGMSISGLEDEYNLSSPLPRLIYIKTPTEKREAGLDQMLQRIQQESAVSYKRFSTPQELGELVENDLALLLAESYEASERMTGESAAERSPGSLENLLFPHNPLLGREQELQTVCNWLSQEDLGLVTLTGPAGVGKSRLALEAALALREHFPDGAFLVRLTPVRDADGVLLAVAETLGLREIPEGSSTVEVLARFLRHKQMLLVLDNFEQVLDAAPQLSQLLEACPGVRLLVTSRASLRLRGERELRLQTLPVPTLADAQNIDKFSSFASVALFVQRVQSFRPGFAIDADNARTIAKILYRIDGLPLAIELAAGRLRLLSPKQFLKMLRQRFDVLSGGTRDLPERHQTLRSAIDWSYNLLADSQKKLFRRLAVFSGGWSMDEAEAVCNLKGNLGPSILQALEALVDCSLVSSSDGVDGLPRFGMLQSLRDYAYVRLSESGELADISRLHAECFLQFVEAVEPRVRTADRLRWQGILQQDFENIRAALAWASTNLGGLEVGARITIALAHSWEICGQRSEGLQWCERFTALSNASTPVGIRAGLLGVAGGISLVSGKTDSIVPSMLESLECARQSEQKQLLANCLLWTGAWALTLKCLSLAWDYLQESLALFRELGDEWSEVLALNWLGYVAFQRGDRYLAELLSAESLTVARRQGDPWALVSPLLTIAQRALAVGNTARAESSLLDLESVLRTVGNIWDLAWVLNGLGQVRLAQAELMAAKGYFTESLRIARECGNKVVMVLSLLEAAVLITRRLDQATDRDTRWRRSELDTAARLCGVAAPLVSDPTILRRTGAQEVYESMLAHVQNTMEPDEWDCGFTEGAQMSLDKALDAAAAELSPNAAPADIAIA